MGKIATGFQDFSDNSPNVSSHESDDLRAENIIVLNAGDEAASRVVNADQDGRSQWVWILFPNGALFLAVAPQGETYFDVEADVERAYMNRERD